MEYGAVRSDGEPMLTWPYSHPDRVSPTEEVGNVNAGSNRLQLPEGEPEIDTRYHLQPASTSTAFMILWKNIEQWILDGYISLDKTISWPHIFT